MQRMTTITVPTAFQSSLYTLLLALGPSFIPAFSILPDRCCGLKITTPSTNTGTVQLVDRFNTGVGSVTSTANAFFVLYDRAEMRNVIDLNAFFPVASAAGQAMQVVLDYT